MNKIKLIKTKNKTIKMALKKGDFIEVEYTGSLDGQVFDTTSKETAQKSGTFNPQQKYENITICIGEGQLLKGLDKFIEGKETNKEYETKISPDDAFGKKDARLIQMVPRAKFSSQKINPQQGMQLNIDGALARVVQVSGGRILVDFNHPLAGREVEYKIKVVKKIDDKKEQLKSTIRMELGLDKTMFDVSVEGDKGTITLPENLKTLIETVKDKLVDKIKETVKLKEVKVDYKKEEKKEANKESKEKSQAKTETSNKAQE